MKLSKNFSLHELTRSSVALRLGIPNVPNAKEVKNLTRLCVGVLQPVRDYFAAPVNVTSGYRCPELNAAVRGSPTSDHVKGCAADIEIWGVSNHELACWIRDNIVPFNQVILEFHDPMHPNSGWVHVSLKPQHNREQALTASFRDGKVTYAAGLPSD